MSDIYSFETPIGYYVAFTQQDITIVNLDNDIYLKFEPDSKDIIVSAYGMQPIKWCMANNFENVNEFIELNTRITVQSILTTRMEILHKIFLKNLGKTIEFHILMSKCDNFIKIHEENNYCYCSSKNWAVYAGVKTIQNINQKYIFIQLNKIKFFYYIDLNHFEVKTHDYNYCITEYYTKNKEICSLSLQKTKKDTKISQKNKFDLRDKLTSCSTYFLDEDFNYTIGGLITIFNLNIFTRNIFKSIFIKDKNSINFRQVDTSKVLIIFMLDERLCLCENYEIQIYEPNEFIIPELE